MYHELVFHLDLCMLSYHLHAQTLVWPLDPYMEQVATSTTERRENFMAEVHEEFTGKPAYHGPGKTQGWPSNVLLDPLISRYDRLYPWRPVFVGPGRRDWLWHNTPKAIIDPIQHVYMQQYAPGNNDNPVLQSLYTTPIPAPALIASRVGGVGNDLLYCFEGGTGTIELSAPSWSLMGFCLARTNADGTYDVHVTFRGSRSGSAGRAAAAGISSGSRSVFAVRNRDEWGDRHWVVPGTTKHVPRGNGDWITDMDMNTTVADKTISAHGSACRGFSSAVKTSLPLIVKCLEAIHAAKGGAPRLVWVTGHSLGGALAGEFASAMVCGTKYGPFGSKLLNGVQTWPWHLLRLVTMSAPVVGGEDFHTTLNSRIYARRVVLAKDPITQSLRHYHVGSHVHLAETPGSTAGLPYTDHHEPFKVRRSLLVHTRRWEDDIATIPVPLVHDDDHAAEPWKKYTSFRDMLHQQVGLAADIPVMMAQHPAEFAHYLQVLKRALKHKSTHNAGHGGKKFWKPRVSDDEKAEYDTKINAAIRLLLGASVGNLQAWNDALLDVGGPSLNKFLRLGMLLGARVRGVLADSGGPMDLAATLTRFDLEDI